MPLTPSRDLTEYYTSWSAYYGGKTAGYIDLAQVLTALGYGANRVLDVLVYQSAKEAAHYAILREKYEEESSY